MHTTNPQNSMMSLLMSLGRTLGENLDLTRLEASADGASGATDFSSLLEKLTAGDEAAALPGAFFQSGDGNPDGQMLPQGLALTGNDLPSEVAAMVDGMPEDELNQLLSHMTEPVQMRVQLNPDNASIEQTAASPQQLSAQITAPAVRLDDAIRPDGRTEPDYALSDGKDALMNAGNGEGRGVVSALNAELRRMAQARSSGSDYAGELNKPGQVQQQLQQFVQDRQASTPESQSLTDQGIDDASLNGLTLDPETVNDSPDYLKLQRDRGALSATSVLSPANDNGLTPAQQVQAAAEGAVVRQEAREAAADMAELTDADEVLLDDGVQETLQQQLNDKMRFGEDRKEWGTTLGARVLTMVADDVQQARIHLDPPELGSLEIKLQVNQDQTSVQIQASNHQVRDVLEASAQRLREALNSQGMELAGFDVQTGAQGQQSGSDSSGQQQGFEGDGVIAQEASEETTQTQRSQASELNLLDTFA